LSNSVLGCLEAFGHSQDLRHRWNALVIASNIVDLTSFATWERAIAAGLFSHIVSIVEVRDFMVNAHLPCATICASQTSPCSTSSVWWHCRLRKSNICWEVFKLRVRMGKPVDKIRNSLSVFITTSVIPRGTSQTITDLCSI
jgi:hypothetical protein